jgi:CelD/BcsL family acetyltransferase involved in cellulose biosynthesis
MSLVVVENPADLPARVPEWEALAAAAMEPNVFFEPWLLLPAARHFGDGKSLRFVFIYQTESPGSASPPPLCGFFPFERRSSYSGLPVSALKLWKHDYCFLCTPLLRREFAQDCLAALFEWAAGASGRATLLEFGMVAGEGEFNQALVDYLFNTQHMSHLVRQHTRAFFRRRGDGDAYLKLAVSGDERRNLKRKQRRLAEAGGAVTYSSLERGEDLGPWLEEFLRLEASGWKGQGGTALACREGDRQFFLDVARQAFECGQLLLLSMKVGDKAVAMRCNFTAGEGSFFFKPGYDEAASRFSPGLLLEVETIQVLHRHGRVQWMDSCTTPDNEMLNRLWLDRRTIQTLVVATGRAPGGLAVSLLPLLRWANRTLRRLLPKRKAAGSPGSAGPTANP